MGKRKKEQRIKDPIIAEPSLTYGAALAAKKYNFNRTFLPTENGRSDIPHRKNNSALVEMKKAESWS